MKKIFLKLVAKRTIYLLIVPILFASCSANQKITYKTENIPALSNTIPIRVNIREFSDVRANSSENLLLFEKGKQTRHNGKSVCINSEKHYNKETVTSQISRQIAEHFEQIKLFQRTTFGHNTRADYYLTGSLSYFYGVQGFSTSASVGSQFGLIGALATSGAKTPADIIIEIKDLALYDRNGNLVQEFGTFRREYSGDMRADAYCLVYLLEYEF